MQSHPCPTKIPLIELRSVSRRFGTVWANKAVSVRVHSGEIHAVVGENGAGKSTLMKMLFGLVRPDEGAIHLQGNPVRFKNPRDAMRSGIGMVHQEPLIFPQLMALENIVAGAEPSLGGWIRAGEAKRRIAALCSVFEFDLPLQSAAGELSYAHRQQIELLRVLYRDARILILDEPTSLLAPPEVAHLLSVLLRFKSEGRTVLFISHRLQEVFAVADRISVLRRGKLIGTKDKSRTSPEEVMRLIMGEGGSSAGDRLATEASPETKPPKVLVSMRRLETEPAANDAVLEDFDFEILQGEIVGIGGVVGNGQRTLAGTLAGLTRILHGRLEFKGQDVTSLSLEDRVRRGIHWLPANVLEEALLPERPLWENVLLGHQRDLRFQRRGFLCRSAVARWARGLLDAQRVAYASLHAPLQVLSGGNQQRTALARLLTGSPPLLVLEQPTRGLDIRAQERFRTVVRDMSGRGCTFIVLSCDLDELLSVCHRVGILYRGRLMGVVSSKEAHREELGRWMLGMMKASLSEGT